MADFSSSQMLPVGTMLDGRYRIERYLASGGFGNTYMAFDTRFNSHVAVKEFFMRDTNHRADDHSTVLVSNDANQEGFEQQLDKFRREAKRIFNLRNDHIVHVIDLFDTNGTSYYVMDFVDGESLKDRVKRQPMTEAEVRDVADQLLDALDAVHKAGFYHLDVKPGNIMTDKNGHCTLIDFGASKQMSAMERTSLSASGMAYTPGYAPIEQEGQRTKSIGPWTDFYAVGATLYHLLTGERPPEVEPYDTAADSRMFDYPEGVSTAMQRAISCMMNPDIRKRPQNVEEMKAVLTGLPLSNVSGSTVDDTVTTRRGGASMPARTSVLSEETKIRDKKWPKENVVRPEDTASIYNTTSSSRNKLWFVVGVVGVCIVVAAFFLLRPSGSTAPSDTPLSQNNLINRNDSIAKLDSIDKLRQDSIQRVEVVSADTIKANESVENLNVMPSYAEINKLADKMIKGGYEKKVDPDTKMKLLDKTTMSPNEFETSYGKDVTFKKRKRKDNDILYDFFFQPTSPHAIYLKAEWHGRYLEFQIGFNSRSDSDVFDTQRRNDKSQKALSILSYNGMDYKQGWYIFNFGD